MSDAAINYFVCTLGEAVQDGIARPYTDVNQLVEIQAKNNPGLPAVGFYATSSRNGDTELVPHVLTFAEVHNGVSVAADLLQQQITPSPGQTIALLAASSPEFFFVWLACIRLGLPVLLVAPQLSPAAIAHLCKACSVSILLTDDKHEVLGKRACDQSAALQGHVLEQRLTPLAKSDNLFTIVQKREHRELPKVQVKQDDIAYLHHTSGTSSGLPKAIPQSQRGSVAVLPALEGQHVATFSTTPLYHGAPADIMRSWTSCALVWLFPGKDLPITAANISKCLAVARDVADWKEYPHIGYFASVPYILQMMVEDDTGIEWLQRMKIVSVGGAALPTETGDRMVKEGINLVSRFGSSEVGFLLSSHRDYAEDHEWQYLRHNPNVSQIEFEKRDGGLYELIAKSNWPHVAKRNREDGSLATSDLFVPHPQIKNAWRYHSRADSQLTLVTGEKFDPAPIEDAIAASSSLLADVLIFGNGKPYPGVLLLRSEGAKEIPDNEILSKIGLVVEKVNADSPSHARIPRNMLVILPHQDQPLEKSSKGTVVRRKAEERFENEIEQAYQAVSADLDTDVPDEEVSGRILDLVGSIMGDRVDVDSLEVNTDLFSYGVDSVACVQIRHGLKQLLPSDSKPLPLTVVEDSRTVSALADLVTRVRHGGTVDEKVDQRSQIFTLIKQYSELDVSKAELATSTVGNPCGGDRTILLTGPTGSLGSHVLSHLLSSPSHQVSHIYLLVRGATPAASRERILKALTSRQLPIPSNFDARVTILSCKLSAPQLGLSDDDYCRLREEVTTIFHLAWQVNFLLSLGSFTQHLSGLRNLLQLSLSSRRSVSPRLVFCSSVASVSNYSSLHEEQNIPERIVANSLAAGSTGYSQSKLTAELILSSCAAVHPDLYDRITIVRVGQLSASTRSGVWNGSEAYPQVLASAKFTDGLLPDLGAEEKLTWLPVDIAAEAFVEAGIDESKVFLPTMHVNHKKGEPPQHKVNLNGSDIKIDTSASRVVHLLNPDMRYTFTEFLVRLRATKQNINASELKTIDGLTITSANQWLEKLESLQQQQQKNSAIQSLLRLLPFWKQIYSNRQPLDRSSSVQEDESMTNLESSQFDMHNSLITMPALTRWLGRNTVEGGSGSTIDTNGDDNTSSRQNSELLKEEYICRTWKWIYDNVPARDV